MKKSIICFCFLVFAITESCVTYKYTKAQYDEAMNAAFVGKNIANIRSTTPYPITETFSDGKGGKVYKFDLSVNYNTPSYSNSNTSININKNSPDNISIYGTTNTTSNPSTTITQKNYISLFTDKSGIVYNVEYLLSPKMLNSSYEIYMRNMGY